MLSPSATSTMVVCSERKVVYYRHMHTGIILLVWLVTAVVLVVGLVASGFVSIKIEKIDPDDSDWDDDTDDE